MEGVRKKLPDPNEVPPVGTLYQLSVPALAVACKVSVPVSHRLAGVVAVIAGVGLAVANTAVLAEAQVPLEAST